MTFRNGDKNRTLWTFIYHSAPEITLWKDTRAFHRRLFVVQTNVYWLLYQLTLQGKLPVWSRTCTANEWLHQDDISASQAFWSLATETFLLVPVVCLNSPLISVLHWCILRMEHTAEITWCAGWLINDCSRSNTLIYFDLLQ